MLKKKVLTTLRDRDLISGGDKVLVGVSGGPDSIALLHMLCSLSRELGIVLHAAHLNHMIRGLSADEDLRFVEAFCGKHDIPFTAKKTDVPLLSKREHLSLEDAGRRARYGFFLELAGLIGADKIALGHTADDNIETILMRLVTGTGARGLMGIAARRGKIIRPLIDAWRSEVEAYCKKHKLNPRIDRTNYDTKYLRNKIRHKLIPFLEQFNPNVKSSIAQTAEILGADYQYMIDMSEKGLVAATLRDEDRRKVLDIDRLLMYPDPIKRYVLRLAIEDVKGDLEDITYSHIEDISSLLSEDKRWELHLPKGLFVGSDGDKLEICQGKPAEGESAAFEYEFTVPGILKIPEAGVKVEARLIENISGIKLKLDNKNKALLDIAKTGRKLLVRSRRGGDLFFPFKGAGRKKLKDYLIDEKVPAAKKDMVPIVCSGNKIVWVAGHRIDDSFKITKRTRRALLMTIEAL